MLKKILENRITTKWWLPDAVEDAKLNEVIDCAYLAPSKGGKFDHTIYVIGNSVEGRALKEYMFWQDTYCLGTIRAGSTDKETGLRRYNGQVNAPIVLVWLAKRHPRTNNLTEEDEMIRVRDDCIVSATVAMCAAESLGLQTGFCSCLSHIDLASKVTGVPINELKDIAIVAMGIGYGYTEPLSQPKTVYKDSVYSIVHPNTQPKSYPNAYELLLKNKNYIISEITEFIKKNVTENNPGFATELLNVNNVEKCKRDCNLIIGALLHDLQFNSYMATKTVISQYWNNGAIQVKRVMVEKLVYEYMKNIILNYIFTNTSFSSLQTESTQYIDMSLTSEFISTSIIDSLISIILRGFDGLDILPQIGMDVSNLVPTNRFTPNRKRRPSKDFLVKYV